MKQKDIALIIIIAAISGVVSLFVSKALFAAPANRAQKVEVVDAITTEFNKPDSKYFNSSSINPTQTVPVGESNNANPFNGAN